MPSEWDEALYGLGLIPPEEEGQPAQAASVPSFQGARNFLFAPLPDTGAPSALHSLATSIGPTPGTVANTFLATMGAPPAAKGFLGGASKALDELDAVLASLKQTPPSAAATPKYTSTNDLLKQLEEILGKPEAPAAPQPIDLWKTSDHASIPTGHPVQAGEGGPIGTFKGVSPDGTTLVDWKTPPAGAKAAPSQDYIANLASLWHNGEPLPGQTSGSAWDINTNVLPKLGVEPNAFWQTVRGGTPNPAATASKWASAQPTPADAPPPSVLSDEAISAALAKDPGASIFDLAGHSELASKPEPYKRTPVDYSEHLTPIEDWNALTSKHGPASFEDIGTRERARQTGFNVDLPLFKGGHLAEYPEALIDPMSKGSEHGVFFSPERRIAEKYTGEGAEPLEYVARAKNPMEVDWETAVGMPYYSASRMNDIITSARAKGADMLVIRNIRDIGGRQDQYVVLDPSIIRRPDAAFNPNALHLNKLAAGLAGAAALPALASPFLFDEQNRPYVVNK